MDIKFSCSSPECQQHIVVDDSAAGRWLKCPSCGKPQRVPGKPSQSLYEGLLREAKARAAALDRAQNAAALPTRLSRRILRMLIGWTAGAALLGISTLGLHIGASAKLPKNFNAMLEDVCSVGDFRYAPWSNHAGTKLLYARNAENGVGVFLVDLYSLQQSQLNLVSSLVPSRSVSAMVLGQERVTWSAAQTTLSNTGLPMTMVPWFVLEVVDRVETTLQL